MKDDQVLPKQVVPDGKRVVHEHVMIASTKAQAGVVELIKKLTRVSMISSRSDNPPIIEI